MKRLPRMPRILNAACSLCRVFFTHNLRFPTAPECEFPTAPVTETKRKFVSVGLQLLDTAQHYEERLSVSTLQRTFIWTTTKREWKDFLRESITSNRKPESIDALWTNRKPPASSKLTNETTANSQKTKNRHSFSQSLCFCSRRRSWCVDHRWNPSHKTFLCWKWHICNDKSTSYEEWYNQHHHTAAKQRDSWSSSTHRRWRESSILCGADETGKVVI